MISTPDLDHEAEVIRIWTELGLRPLGPADDFFDLGGQSLTLVRFLARVQDSYGVELPVDTLFETDLTVASAAEAVRQARLAAALAELDGLSDDEVAALLAAEA